MIAVKIIIGNGINMEKVQFGRIIDGKLKYDDGESDSTVFPGLAFILCVIML